MDPSTPLRTQVLKNTTKKHLEIPASPYLQKLGYGTGIGVYKLERSPVQNKVQSPWAIKKLLTSLPKNKLVGNQLVQDRLKEEAKVLAKLNHPNIVGFRAFIISNDNMPCLAMEECTISLGDKIEDRADRELLAFPAENILKVASHVARALNYLHNTALILHCDIKSYNVLIKGEFAICKLCDFGASLPLTKEGLVDCQEEYCGTSLWMAPEVLKDPQEITTKADIYSYGLVLWEMLALTHPNLDTRDEDDSIQDTSVDEEEEISRPELPSQEFGECYNHILEIFYCCTEFDLKSRPTAAHLDLILTQINDNKTE